MNIENNTPWNTEDLIALVNTCSKTRNNFITIRFLTIPPVPRRSKDKQPLLRAERSIHDLTIELLSPKRAAGRTDLLDRMSHTQTLHPHEIAMPPRIVAGIIHSVSHVLDGGIAHVNLACDCDLSTIKPRLIRGDTKARVRPKRGLQGLKASLDKLTKRLARIEKKVIRSNRAINWWEKSRDKNKKNAEIVAAKIDKMKIKIEHATNSMNQTEPLVSAINKED